MTLSVKPVSSYFKLKPLPLGKELLSAYTDDRTYSSTLKNHIRSQSPLDVSSMREVGIEIEIENVPIDEIVISPSSFWRLDHDGSLRNSGVELISKVLVGPVVGCALGQLTELFDSFDNCEFSHRCSIHVHVNVRDLSFHQLVVLIANYLVLEPILLLEVDEFRRRNSFCTPLSNCDFTIHDITSLNSNRIRDWKYFAFNFGCASTYGTVEFRHLEGTKDVNRLRNWVATCQQIVDMTKKLDIDAQINEINNLNTSSAYSEFVKKFLSKPMDMNYKREVERNVTAAKRLLQS